MLSTTLFPQSKQVSGSAPRRGHTRPEYAALTISRVENLEITILVQPHGGVPEGHASEAVNRRIVRGHGLDELRRTLEEARNTDAGPGNGAA